MNEYIKINEYKYLIGKRAKFKYNLKGYTSDLWNREGIIKQLFQVKQGDLDHVGLSLVFNKPFRMKSCYIVKYSIILLDNNNKEVQIKWKK